MTHVHEITSIVSLRFSSKNLQISNLTLIRSQWAPREIIVQATLFTDCEQFSWIITWLDSRSCKSSNNFYSDEALHVFVTLYWNRPKERYTVGSIFATHSSSACVPPRVETAGKERRLLSQQRLVNEPKGNTALYKLCLGVDLISPQRT